MSDKKVLVLRIWKYIEKSLTNKEEEDMEISLPDGRILIIKIEHVPNPILKIVKD